MSTHPLRIAVLPGDGIGREVIAEEEKPAEAVGELRMERLAA
jgi:isocitrate/isopropylmalate dehydrogenase